MSSWDMMGYDGIHYETWLMRLLFSDCGFDRDMAGFLLKMETLRHMRGKSRHFDWAMAIIAMCVSSSVDNGGVEDFGVETHEFHIFHG